MIWEAIGGIALFVITWLGALWCAFRAGKVSGRAELQAEMAERRSLRRAEKRASAYAPRHQLAPWPGPEAAEQLASTGELKALAAAAESGDLDELGRQNAAFFRLIDLHMWTAKARNREHAG